MELVPPPDIGLPAERNEEAGMTISNGGAPEHLVGTPAVRLAAEQHVTEPQSVEKSTQNRIHG